MAVIIDAMMATIMAIIIDVIMATIVATFMATITATSTEPKEGRTNQLSCRSRPGSMVRPGGPRAPKSGDT